MKTINTRFHPELSPNKSGVGRLPRATATRRLKLALWGALCVLGLSTRLLADLSAGLVHYYPFNGDANDAKGSNNGVVTGATLATDRCGNTNGAYYFDGASDISFTSPPSLNPQGSFSYTWWMASTLETNYTAPLPYHWLWFLDRTTGTVPLVSLALMTEPYGQFWFSARYDEDTTPGGTNTLVGGMLTPQNWQHFAMVREYNNAFRLYVNGVAVGSLPDNGKALTPPILKLGMHAWDGHLGLVGKMDDVRIYSRALSKEEVQKLFTEPGLGIAVSQVRLCWNSSTNKTYQTQYRSKLTSDVWVNLGSPIPGNGETQCITDDVVGPQRFYQVLPSP